MHERLREALRLTRSALDEGAAAQSASADLLLYCKGFCVALTGHHEAEDRTLFPAISAEHPELAPTIRRLEQDHSMIGYLLGNLQAAVDRTAPRAELERHLEGVAAIMESHFGYEERALSDVLAALQLEVEPSDALGPLG
ncbi:hypothetical protein GCM10027298_21820 [Epidermidibacterium keratini]